MRFKVLIFFFLSGLLCSCKGIGLDNIFNKSFSIDERAKFKDIELTDSDTNSNSYSVIVISDVHFSRGKHSVFLQKLKNLDFTEYGNPAMMLVLGDIGEDGYHSQYKEFNDFSKEISDFLHIPVFPIPGNHDTFDKACNGKNYIEDIFPTSFYRIKYHNISWYFLDSADGTFGYNQIHTLENLFSTDSDKKIICTHYPLYAKTMYYRLSNYKEKAHLINLYSKNNVQLTLCGHTHIYYKHNFGSFEEIVCGNLTSDDEPASFVILSFDQNGNYQNIKLEL